jgi:hypothetical protein
MPVTCLLCGDHTRDWPAMLNHFRLMHPDIEIELPGGSPCADAPPTR